MVPERQGLKQIDPAPKAPQYHIEMIHVLSVQPPIKQSLVATQSLSMKD